MSSIAERGKVITRRVGIYLMVVMLLASVALSTGCASMRVRSAKKHLESTLNPLIGQGENDVILAVGAPAAREQIGDFVVWHYYQGYGSRASAYVTPNPYVTSAGAQSWEAYDRYDLYFRDDVLVKWSGYVQR